MGTTNKTLSATVAAAADRDNIKCFRNRVSIVGLATAEVVQCLSIPAGMLVLNVMVKVVTPEASGAATATIGDGAGANSWDASTNLAAAAGTVTAGVGGTDAYVTTGKLYAADTIDAVLTLASGPATSGVFDIMAICVEFPPTAGSV